MLVGMREAFDSASAWCSRICMNYMIVAVEPLHVAVVAVFIYIYIYKDIYTERNHKQLLLLGQPARHHKSNLAAGGKNVN
jgi:hypothetical protein